MWGDLTDIAVYVPGFLAAYAILIVGAASPGPSVALLIGIATGQGRLPALIATTGIATGSATINVLTMIGVGVLVSQAAWAILVLKLLGAAYLAYLAFCAFRKAAAPPAFSPMQSGQRTWLRWFAVGYALQVTNPKAIAFWLAIAAVGATEGAGLFVKTLFVFGAFMISFACHGAWALVMSAQRARAAYAAGRRWIEATLGIVFSVFAWKLATSET